MSKKSQTTKIKLIKELEENPLVDRVCRKLGLSRATFYRWREDDPVFKAAVERAQLKGRAKLNDFVESKLLENINANHHAAIAFWLMHNNKIYRHRYIRTYAEENERLREEVRVRQEVVDSMINLLGEDRIAEIIGEVDAKTFKSKVIKKQRRLGSSPD